MSQRVTHGADTEVLDDVAAALRRQGDNVDEVGGRGSAYLEKLRALWDGPDFEEFAKRWRRAHRETDDASQALKAYSKKLVAESDDQRESSRSPDGGGGSGGETRVPRGGGQPETHTLQEVDRDGNGPREHMLQEVDRDGNGPREHMLQEVDRDGNGPQTHTLVDVTRDGGGRGDGGAFQLHEWEPPRIVRLDEGATGGLFEHAVSDSGQAPSVHGEVFAVHPDVSGPTIDVHDIGRPIFDWGEIAPQEPTVIGRPIIDGVGDGPSVCWDPTEVQDWLSGPWIR